VAVIGDQGSVMHRSMHYLAGGAKALFMPSFHFSLFTFHFSLAASKPLHGVALLVVFH